jgi:hypothetical protein
VSEAFIQDISGCMLFCKSFTEAPIEGVDWVVTVSRYSLLKFFYFIVYLGVVILSCNKGKLISPFHIFIWRTIYTTHFRCLDNLCYMCRL